jgi:hypothetical protein
MNGDEMNPLPAKCDDGERKQWIAEALGVEPSAVFFTWEALRGWPLTRIRIKHRPDLEPDGLTAMDIVKLREAGIVATARGWAFEKEQNR